MPDGRGLAAWFAAPRFAVSREKTGAFARRRQRWGEGGKMGRGSCPWVLRYRNGLNRASGSEQQDARREARGGGREKKAAGEPGSVLRAWVRCCAEEKNR